MVVLRLRGRLSTGRDGRRPRLGWRLVLLLVLLVLLVLVVVSEEACEGGVRLFAFSITVVVSHKADEVRCVSSVVFLFVSARRGGSAGRAVALRVGEAIEPASSALNARCSGADSGCAGNRPGRGLCQM